MFCPVAVLGGASGPRNAGAGNPVEGGFSFEKECFIAGVTFCPRAQERATLPVRFYGRL